HTLRPRGSLLAARNVPDVIFWLMRGAAHIRFVGFVLNKSLGRSVAWPESEGVRHIGPENESPRSQGQLPRGMSRRFSIPFRKGSISFAISSIERAPGYCVPLMKKVGVD